MTDVTNLTFLKLGGSLITDKNTPKQARFSTIERILREVKNSIHDNPDMHLVLGHGSGSFGHYVGNQYHTRDGVRTQKEWSGFFEVYAAARQLNQIIYQKAIEQDIPIIPFPLCTNAAVRNRTILNWSLEPMINALHRGFLPLVYGDVAFDQVLGGTILSTEEIFTYLAEQLEPERILIAGVEPGIWADYPQNTQIIPQIHLKKWEQNEINLQGSASTDVTGGMRAKVESMLDIIRKNPSCEIAIFSGEQDGAIQYALSGQLSGTTITA